MKKHQNLFLAALYAHKNAKLMEKSIFEFPVVLFAKTFRRDNQKQTQLHEEHIPLFQFSKYTLITLSFIFYLHEFLSYDSFSNKCHPPKMGNFWERGVSDLRTFCQMHS